MTAAFVPNSGHANTSPKKGTASRSENKEMKPSELIQRAMRRSKAASGAALGELIGVDRRRIADYAKDERWPDNNHTRLLAEAAGLNPFETIAELEMARASDEATRSAWGKALASLRRSAAAFVLAMLATLAASGLPASTSPSGLGFRRR